MKIINKTTEKSLIDQFIIDLKKDYLIKKKQNLILKSQSLILNRNQ